MIICRPIFFELHPAQDHAGDHKADEEHAVVEEGAPVGLHRGRVGRHVRVEAPDRLSQSRVYVVVRIVEEGDGRGARGQGTGGQMDIQVFQEMRSTGWARQMFSEAV